MTFRQRSSGVRANEVLMLTGRGADVGLGQRDDLRTGRRARRVQDQSNVVGPGGRRLFDCDRPNSLFAVEDEEPRRPVRERTQFDDRDTERSGNFTRGGVEIRLDDQRPRVEIGQVELELGRPVGGIERRAGRGGCHRQEGGCHLRPIRQHGGDPVVSTNAVCSQLRHGDLDVTQEVPVGQGVAARSEDRGRAGLGEGLTLQELKNAGARGHEVTCWGRAVDWVEAVF